MHSLVMMKRNRSIFPDNASSGFFDGGLYPDVEDPQFVSRLLQKTEFADTKSEDYDPSANPCAKSPDFEVTPVQRFVANFLHPRTPYMSALLYHGVGVGKTCAAIQSAEAYLDAYPRRRVIIVCPRAIRSGFFRTIFDIEKLEIGSGESPNMASGCTGDTYLKLAGCLMERDREIILKKVTRVINRRYELFGYGQFANHIRNIKNKIPPTAVDNKIQVGIALRKEFDYRMLIVDEAHNLRDVVGSATLQKSDEDIDTMGEADDIKGAKELTPFLKELLQITEGMKLLLMTATPMFNSVFEITFLINLLLMNDKKKLLLTSALLNQDGSPSAEAEENFKRVANAYVSFMRGENPNSFPLRLFPEGNDPIGNPVRRLQSTDYPDIMLSKSFDTAVPDTEKRYIEKLPIVISSAGDEEDIYNQVIDKLTTERVQQSGTGYQITDSLLQAGNCVFPTGDAFDIQMADAYVGQEGFDSIFTKDAKGAVRANDAKWLVEENLRNYSPKIATILRFIKHSEGVDFVYSRFVTTGAFLVALALEANGYTPYGRDRGFLVNGIQDVRGRQCALCSLRENAHAVATHGFVPAKYVLLTGDAQLSPNNAEAISVARSLQNVDGKLVKVVIGSQIAGEGVDLRFIREVHILDAWFHLNKTEQIIGRAIRFLSHCELPPEKRNTTIFLHAVQILSEGVSVESADLFSYRTALKKSVQIGRITRMLKHYAVDCNLRKNVVFLTDSEKMGTRDQRDSQRILRSRVPLRDMDYSAVCDWMDCPEDFTCDPDIEVNMEQSDDSTYDAFSAKFTETKMKKQIQLLFSRKPYIPFDALVSILVQQGYSMSAVSIILQGIINNRLFRIQSGKQEGYLIYKNRYILFQPDAYRDLKIPMALRIAAFPVKRDAFEPRKLEPEVQTEVKTAAATVEVEAAEEDVDTVSLWDILVQWTDDIVTGKVSSITSTLSSEIDKITGSHKKQKDVLHEKLSAILYLNRFAIEKDKYKSAILEYFWDEWLSDSDQVKYIRRNIHNASALGNEMLLESGREKVIRYVNSETTQLNYICSDGKPCPRGIVEAFQELESDVVKESKADVLHAGKLYGFIVPKRGKLVFKTQPAHPVGKKPDRGQECAIITSPSHYIDKLILLGSELTKYGFPNMDLDMRHLDSSIEIKNTTRGCTFLDLVLRYMNKLRVGGKQWFFRPIASYFSGHRGLMTDAAKTALTAAERELKEMEEKEPVAKEVTAAKKPRAPAIKKVVVAPPQPVVPQVAAPPPVAPQPVVPQVAVVAQPQAQPPKTILKPSIKKPLTLLKRPTTVVPAVAQVSESEDNSDVELEVELDNSSKQAKVLTKLAPEDSESESESESENNTPPPKKVTVPATTLRQQSSQRAVSPEPEIEFEESESESENNTQPPKKVTIPATTLRQQPPQKVRSPESEPESDSDSESNENTPLPKKIQVPTTVVKPPTAVIPQRGIPSVRGKIGLLSRPRTVQPKVYDVDADE